METARERRLRAHPNVFYLWQVEQLVGVSRRTLRRWHHSGLYSPRIPRGALRYDFQDLCVLLCISKMRARGLSCQLLREHLLTRLLECLELALGAGLQLTELKFSLMPGPGVSVYKDERSLYEEAELTVDFGAFRKEVNRVKPLLVKGGTPLGEIE